LERALERLNIAVPIPIVPSADVIHKPIDLYRSYLADILYKITGADATTAYSSVQLSSDPLLGDLAVVLPRLCSKNKAAEVAQAIKDQVSGLDHFVPTQD
jgi:arginyl-tRNA synthetase